MLKRKTPHIPISTVRTIYISNNFSIKSYKMTFPDGYELNISMPSHLADVRGMGKN